MSDLSNTDALRALVKQMRDWYEDAEIGAGYNSQGVHNTIYLDTVRDWIKALERILETTTGSSQRCN